MARKRTLQRFEDLPVWKAAARLFVDVQSLTRRARWRDCGDLVNQLRRSTLSISNNIAEGFERGSTAELILFLSYARGSAGETRSMLTILLGMDQADDLKSEIFKFEIRLRARFPAARWMAQVFEKHGHQRLKISHGRGPGGI